MLESNLEPQGALPADDLTPLPVDAGNRDTVLAACLPAAMFNLRVDPAEAEVSDKVSAAFGVVLPNAANTKAVAGDREAIWLGPDEWLLSAPLAERNALADALGSALGGHHHACSDVSDAFTRLHLAGPHALDMLAKGCPFDLHPSQFAPPAVAGTVVAKSQATLIAMDNGAVDVLVRRSFADYLWLWLKHAGAEYGVVTGAL